MTNVLLAKEKGRSRLFRRGGTHNEICVAESHKRARARTYKHTRARAPIHAPASATYTRSSDALCARARVCVFVCVTPGALRVADPLAWIIKVLNLVSHCGLIITAEHHARAHALSVFSLSRGRSTLCNVCARSRRRPQQRNQTISPSRRRRTSGRMHFFALSVRPENYVLANLARSFK